jgi:glycosyltransferase involved in cell wall biosynthesis
MAYNLKQVIGLFVERYNIDVLVPENALAIPMHIPLGMATTDFIKETGIVTLNHNHDFFWERERFQINCIPDILDRCFPPDLPSIQHLVINSLAQDSLRERKSIESALLPNIFDFDTAAPGMSEFNLDLRSELGLTDDELFILQPTRVVPRKGIELTIELVRKLNQTNNQQRLLGKNSVLVITHHAGDEGWRYLRQLEDQAAEAGFRLVYAADRFAPTASVREGKKIYALWDAYVHTDFVTYPSFVEGFGNGLLETLYFRVPALVNRYGVYAADIGPLGFDLVEIDGRITESTVQAVIEAIIDPVRRRRMVERNYHLARQHFSYEAVTPLLEDLVE